LEKSPERVGGLGADYGSREALQLDGEPEPLQKLVGQWSKYNISW
jgi:hypothetical protein